MEEMLWKEDLDMSAGCHCRHGRSRWDVQSAVRGQILNCGEALNLLLPYYPTPGGLVVLRIHVLQCLRQENHEHLAIEIEALLA